MTEPAPARLFVILAREAPVGVIFRRGPSKQVELIRWDTSTDTFDRGHWFKGRIYESCCDLSPDGKLLLYYAAKMHRSVADPERFGTWTAICRPPWLTALALWPVGRSACWLGGGLFLDDRSVLLCHASAKEPLKGRLPNGFQITANWAPRPPNGRKFPRPWGTEGWRHQSREQHSSVWEKPSLDYGWFLRMTQVPITNRFQCSLASTTSELSIPLNHADWADWDQQGRLVFARHGKLYEGKIDAESQLIERELADFNEDRFEERHAPAWAREW